jgi:hypothetical protein
LEQNQNFLMCSNFFLAKAKRYYIIKKILDLKENVFLSAKPYSPGITDVPVC